MPIQMFNWVSRPQQEFHLNAAATGLGSDGNDPIDERDRNLFSLSIQKANQMVTNGVAGWNTDP